MVEEITFSIEGLTIRGFYEHMHHWVPFTGERLKCELTEDGPISAFKEFQQNVGNIPKEVSKLYKEWLRNNGKLEAVVVTIVPKRHRTKGDEVPVIYLFTGRDTPLMTNMKNSIEIDIQKKKKKKKSLEFHTGDITGNVGRELPGNSLLSVIDQTNQLDFSVLGKSLRGFHQYKKKWVPEIGSRHECFISRQGAVAARFGDNEVCGHVPTDIQNTWKRFLKENGKITAVVAGSPKRHRSKGEEVPMIYVFTGDLTAVLTNFRRIIIADMEKKMKKNKSLSLQAGDATREIGVMNHAAAARASHADSDIEASNETQEEINENNENEPSLKSIRRSRKRGLEENDDAVETARIKKKKKHSSKSAGKISTKKTDNEISLKEKDFHKISQMIVNNWQMLGLELGLRQIEMSRLEMNNSNSCVTIKIRQMLMRWKEIKPDNVTLRHLIKAVNKCSELEIDHEEFRNFISKKRSTLKSVK